MVHGIIGNTYDVHSYTVKALYYMDYDNTI